jgi:hypothetical protein
MLENKARRGDLTFLLWLGACQVRLLELDDDSIVAVITDPPYE